MVFNDADLEQAVKWSHLGIMSNQGQICTATSRIPVQDGIYDEFVAKFKTAVANISKLCDQRDETTYQGPQVSKAQYDCILSYIKIGSEEGATLLMGGEACPINGKWYYISPTVFTNIKDSMRIYREEVFGPFVVISSFKEEEAVVERRSSECFNIRSWSIGVYRKSLKRASHGSGD